MAFQMHGAEGPADLRQPPDSRTAGAKTVLSERWFGQARFTLRLERGFVLQHEGWSATPSARPAGLDDFDGGPDGRLYIQMCRIEQVRVGGLFQGGDCAALVTMVPVPDVGQYLGLADGTPLRLVFGSAPAGSNLWGGSHKDLHVGVRTNDGSDIAPIKNRSRRTGGKLTLERKQGLTHRAYR